MPGRGLFLEMFMRLLVVEDFKPLRDSLVQALREESYAVDATSDGRLAISLISRTAFDAVVLDIMLPGADGLAVLKAINSLKSRPCVLILTARDTLDERVKGLDAGADDYMVKPFSLSELLARLRALIRRRYQPDASFRKVGDLKLDLAARRVFRNELEIELSAREYAILEYLSLRRGQVVSRSDIWEHVYDQNAALESNVVDVFIGLLRRKIETANGPRLIQTRRGQGYLIE